MAEMPARIAAKITLDSETGCWVWVARVGGHGYGVVRWHGSARLAHRVVYSILVGDPGPKLDHRCFNHACVNPEHLRPTTHKQNLEHRQGAQSNSKSGVRGVSWNIKDKRWRVSVGHNGVSVYGGQYLSIDDAERAAKLLREKLFTHDDGMVLNG